MRPQPGQAETWGRNERSPSDWRTCCATATSSVAVAARLGRERDADRVADALVEQDREAGRRGDDALHAHARLGQAQVQRVVAARGEPAVDVDQVAHAADLGAEDDPVVAQAGLLGQLGRAEGGLRPSPRSSRRGRRAAPPGGRSRPSARSAAAWSSEPQLTPIRTGLPLLDRDPDDRREVLVVALGADVAGVDAVLGEGRRHGRVLGQQLVAVVVEVADDRHVDAEVRAPCARSPGTAAAAASLLTVTRTSSEPACASAATWMAVASASAVSVLVIDWTTTGWARADQDAADVDA